MRVSYADGHLTRPTEYPAPMCAQRCSVNRVKVQLTAITNLCLDSRDTFQEITAIYERTPFPGSGAAKVADELPLPDPNVSGRHGQTDRHLVEDVIYTFLLAASEHLGGLAVLYKSDEVLHSPPLLIRAVIENCAHAIWVLGEDAAEAPERRLARAYLEELLSAEEALKAASKMYGKTHPYYINSRTRHKELKQQILSKFAGASKESLGGPKRSLCGQELPRPHTAVEKMYEQT